MPSAAYQRVWNQRVREHHQRLQAVPVVAKPGKYTCAHCGQYIAEKVVYVHKKRRYHKHHHPMLRPAVAFRPVFVGVRP